MAGHSLGQHSRKIQFQSSRLRSLFGTAKTLDCGPGCSRSWRPFSMSLMLTDLAMSIWRLYAETTDTHKTTAPSRKSSPGLQCIPQFGCNYKCPNNANPLTRSLESHLGCSLLF
eukprot:5474997-Amphidinium_carterae.1